MIHRDSGTALRVSTRDTLRWLWYLITSFLEGPRPNPGDLLLEGPEKSSQGLGVLSDFERCRLRGNGQVQLKIWWKQYDNMTS